MWIQSRVKQNEHKYEWDDFVLECSKCGWVISLDDEEAEDNPCTICGAD